MKKGSPGSGSYRTIVASGILTIVAWPEMKQK